MGVDLGRSESHLLTRRFSLPYPREASRRSGERKRGGVNKPKNGGQKEGTRPMLLGLARKNQLFMKPRREKDQRGVLIGCKNGRTEERKKLPFREREK